MLPELFLNKVLLKQFSDNTRPLILCYTPLMNNDDEFCCTIRFYLFIYFISIFLRMMMIMVKLMYSIV